MQISLPLQARLSKQLDITDKFSYRKYTFYADANLIKNDAGVFVLCKRDAKNLKFNCFESIPIAFYQSKRPRIMLQIKLIITIQKPTNHVRHNRRQTHNLALRILRHASVPGHHSAHQSHHRAIENHLTLILIDCAAAAYRISQAIITRARVIIKLTTPFIHQQSPAKVDNPHYPPF